MNKCTLKTGFTFASLLSVVFGLNMANAGDDSAQGRVWYESNEDTEWAMDLKIIVGIAVPKEIQYGERVRVLLLGDTLDHEKFLAVMAKTGNTLLTMSELKIEKSVSFDICSDSNGKNVEVCGIAIHGPGLSLSESGFGTYNHFTQSVSFENGRVAAKLMTVKPEEQSNVSFGFDLVFDLPISIYEID